MLLRNNSNNGQNSNFAHTTIIHYSLFTIHYSPKAPLRGEVSAQPTEGSLNSKAGIHMKKLFEKYDRLFLFDTETTGLRYDKDEIIEFAAVVVELKNGIPTVVEE